MATLTRFEITRIIGTRATQISRGAQPMIDIGDLDNALDIATEEYNRKKIPFLIVRIYPNGTVIEVDPNTGQERPCEKK